MVGAFAACGKQESTDKQVADNTPATTNEQTSATAETKEVTELKGKIEFFQMKREAVDTFNAIIEKFKEQYPSIEVEQNNIPDASQVLTTRMASNDAPDVFTHWPDRAEYKVLIDEGYVLDISNESFLENINPSIIEMIKYKGKSYMVPIALNAMGVFYNVQQFNELGLTIPNTYSEFVELLKKVKAAGKTPLMLPDKDAWTIEQSSCLLTGIWLPDIEGFYDKLQKGEISVKDEPMFRRHAEVLLELREYGQKDTLGTGYDQAIGEFASGKAVMFLQGIWAIPSIKKANPDFEFAMFPFPGEKPEDTKIVTGVDCAVAIAANSKNLELSKTFLSYLASTEAGQIYADLDGSPSAIKGVETKVKEYAAVVEVMNAGKTFKYPYDYWKAGALDEDFKSVQNLIADKNIDEYLERQDTIFKGAYNR